MSLSRRRIWAIVRKELLEYRHNRFIVVGMAVIPLVFLIQPLIAVLGLTHSASSGLAREHVLLYMLGIPALVPGVVSASAVAGERQQGTLEPALTTPIRSDEYLLGKALAALLPSLGVAYFVFAVFLGIVVLFAQPGIASSLIQGPDLVAQIGLNGGRAIYLKTFEDIVRHLTGTLGEGDLVVTMGAGTITTVGPAFLALP